MGGDPKSSAPVFFSKPADAVVPSGSRIAYPSATVNLHYEVELVVALKSGGSELDADRALECIYGYAVGIDFTRRDLQAQASKKADHGIQQRVSMRQRRCLRSNRLSGEQMRGSAGKWRAEAGRKLSDMICRTWIWLSRYFALRAGDLVFTGTPAGVSWWLRETGFRAVSRGSARTVELVSERQFDS